MKTPAISFSIAFMLAAGVLLAQTTNPDTTNPSTTTNPTPTTGGTTGGTTTGGTTPDDGTTKPDDAGTQDTGNETQGTQQGSGDGNLGGFDGVAWGTKYEDVKEKFRVLATNPDVTDPVEIVNDVPDREILVRRRDILYRYAFYKKPAPSEAANKPAAEGDKKAEGDFARFFFVEVNFHLLDTEQLYQKVSGKYGKRTNSTLDKKKMRGAYVWEKDAGFLVQWIEPFNVKPFSRRLTYISKEIRKEIEKDLQDFRFERELKDLKNLLEDK